MIVTKWMQLASPVLAFASTLVILLKPGSHLLTLLGPEKLDLLMAEEVQMLCDVVWERATRVMVLLLINLITEIIFLAIVQVVDYYKQNVALAKIKKIEIAARVARELKRGKRIEKNNRQGGREPRRRRGSSSAKNTTSSAVEQKQYKQLKKDPAGKQLTSIHRMLVEAHQNLVDHFSPSSDENEVNMAGVAENGPRNRRRNRSGKNENDLPITSLVYMAVLILVESIFGPCVFGSVIYMHFWKLKSVQIGATLLTLRLVLLYFGLKC